MYICTYILVKKGGWVGCYVPVMVMVSTGVCLVSKSDLS